MNTILTQEFFNRPVLDVATDLLGKHLVRKINSSIISLEINEVEAYDGSHDLACHGRFGKTKRTEVMFGPAGHFYIYLIYGMHWMLNIVTNEKDYPGAVLIRSAGPIFGPARLTKHLNITKSLNNMSVKKISGLWLEDHNKIIQSSDIKKTPRIGIDYAGPIWSKKLYRFVLTQ